MCFFRKKQQIINFGQDLLAKGVADNNEALFIRSENIVKDANAILVVPPTHTALVIKGGGDARYYKSGNYLLFNDKKEIKAWKGGIPVEVIYFPKDKRVQVGWGTPSTITYRDRFSGKTVKVGANGDCRLSIANPEQFYKRIVGYKKEYSFKDFQSEFRSIIVDRFVGEFLSVVNELSLMYDQFDEKRVDVAAAMQKRLNTEFVDYWGVSLEWFTIGSFRLDENDVAAVEEFANDAVRKRQMQEYLRELERLDDKQWEREKYLRRLEIEDKAAYYELLKVIGTARADGSAKHSASEGQRKGSGYIRCPRCKELVGENSVFCSKCGEKIVL